MARDVSVSPVRHRRSPRRRSPSRREGSPRFNKGNSPKGRISRSPSPRTKRIRRAQAEKESGRNKEREHDRHNGRGSEKSNSKEVEREGERERGRERREREREKSKTRNNGRERDNEIEDKRRHTGRQDAEEQRRSRTDEDRLSRGRHERSTSPLDRTHKSQPRSHSPVKATGSRQNEGSNVREDKEHIDEDDSIAKMKAAEEALTIKQKEEPSFELTGNLAAETNRFRGITLLFDEPPEARKPSVRWRLYVFKGGEPMNEPLYIHRQSCYLFGRERRIADIPTDHPSCSKQHAVIQYRLVEKEQADGMMSKQVRPYIMDLGSTNKTYINESAIEPQRYYELFEKDTIKFGNSSREYVLLHENSTS